MSNPTDGCELFAPGKKLCYPCEGNGWHGCHSCASYCPDYKAQQEAQLEMKRRKWAIFDAANPNNSCHYHRQFQIRLRREGLRNG